MQDESEELMVQAAWYYHVEGMTQANIAERLNLTRRRVNEMLSRAHESGLVSVHFNSPLSLCAELESGLCNRFGLEAAVVVPTPSEPALVHKVLGKATADYLTRLIQARKPHAIGLGWGTTLRETIMSARPQNFEELEVYSIMGGLTHGTEINTFEIVRSFAERFGATGNYLVAPIYMDSAEARQAIVSQASFRKALDAICNADVGLVSVGDVSGRSLQVRYGLPEGVTPHDLVSAGAVGDVIGRYVDSEGRQIDHPLNHQVMSPELEDFRKIQTRIVASGGQHKHAIMRAVVAAGHVNVVITDADCAAHLLGDAAPAAQGAG